MIAEESWRQSTPPDVAATVRRCAVERGSLTERLIATGYPFALRVLYQGLQQSSPDELALFNLALPMALQVRHVVLTLSQVPVVVARSLSRPACPTWHAIHQRGSHSLGLVLFDQHNAITRDRFSYRWIKEGHPLFTLAYQHDLQHTRRYLARRSRFFLNHAPLSVCEVFLPALEAFLR